MYICVRYLGLSRDLIALSLLLLTTSSFAESAQQCNQKLYSTLYGRSASMTELSDENPLNKVNSMMSSEEFIEYFSSFVNAHMNWTPEEARRNNPVYLMMKHYILGEDRPWKELFTGEIEVHDNGFNPKNDASGYFSDRNWKRIYKGNEEGGYKLRTAYLILNNQVGLDLEALTVNNAGGSGRNARQNPDGVCVSCHFNAEFALDRIASVLPLVNRQASDVQNLIESPAPGPFPQIIYGVPVNNLKELTERLSELDDFYRNACHVAFKFVFGRSERGADKEIFSQCVDTFRADGKITTAVRQLINSNMFCKL